MAGNQNFGNIIFRSGDDNYQQEQFERFQQRGVAPTRYPDLTCLQQLGLHQGIEWMLRRADLTFLCTHNQPTYPSLTLEFLSSYDYTTPAGEGEFLTGTAPSLLSLQPPDQKQSRRRLLSDGEQPSCPKCCATHTTLTDVTNPNRHLYDLSAPETTDPSQTNQQTDEFEEMEQGDHPPTQPSVPLNPSSNAAGPSSQRRRRRRPATNDDIMDAIDGMQAQNTEMMQMMRQMQQQQDARNAITDQRFTELFSRFDSLDIRQRSPGPRTRGGRQP
ncbi:hypothetical protein KIW84_072285 [Lathyrus oleraceus]|uniref:Arabidopsis retrotransposon Orf1 C-terminal domain-containing protein n=1 Tax=Pisum sativum TaxID=3888 RepID=A0A9D4VKV3_PEA|nr:hypothetical protein KIW84_072285 [Pisum sativum]